MSIEAWANAARRSQYRQSAEQQHVIGTLTEVFEEKTEPDRAASKIASIYDPSLKQNSQNSPVHELWGMICEAIKILGGEQKIDVRLISLLNSLAKLPDVKDNHGNVVNAGANGNYRMYWKDLPNLAIMFREYAIGTLPNNVAFKPHKERERLTVSRYRTRNPGDAR